MEEGQGKRLITIVLLFERQSEHASSLSFLGFALFFGLLFILQPIYLQQHIFRIKHIFKFTSQIYKNAKAMG